MLPKLNSRSILRDLPKRVRILERFVSRRSIYADPPWWPGRSLGLWNKPDVHFNPISQNALLLLTAHIYHFWDLTYPVLNLNWNKREVPKVNSFPVYSTLEDFSQVDDFPFKNGSCACSWAGEINLETTLKSSMPVQFGRVKARRHWVTIKLQ